MILAGYVFDEPVVVSHQSFVGNILPKLQILPHMMDTSKPSPDVPKSIYFPFPIISAELVAYFPGEFHNNIFLATAEAIL